MTKTNDSSMPLVPVDINGITTLYPQAADGYGGFTAIERACIDLRVPKSGTPWLDKLIAEAQHRDAATLIMATKAATGPLNEDIAKAINNEAKRLEWTTERVMANIASCDAAAILELLAAEPASPATDGHTSQGA